MLYLGDILCLEYEEMVPEVMTESNYKVMKMRGNITVHGRGGNGSQVLIEYASLPDKYRAVVKELYGDPYEYASKQPILNSLEWDMKAQEFYNSYVLPNGDKLPNSKTDLAGKPQINYVHRYTENATWLNMLTRLTTDKRALKRELNIPVMTFWEVATEMIKIKKVDLPKNAKRLKEKMKGYAQGGYESLIELHKWGNDYRMKVDEEQLKAFLRLHTALDDTRIKVYYNDWAKENGFAPIETGTVTYWRKKWKNYLIMYREGKGKAISILKKKISRDRPSAPLLFINGDDNDWDVFFRKPETRAVRDGKQVIIPKNDWFKLDIYVVWDTFNDLPLGWAAGHSITKQVVMDAYRNAARWVAKETNGLYMWHQMQTDKWGIDKGQTTELGQFYKSMATSTPAQLKNPFSKYVERSFGVLWHQTLKEMFPDNYAGHNITAKEQLDRDRLKLNNFPSVETAPKALNDFMNALRNTPREEDGPTRLEEWRAAFDASHKAKKRQLSEAEWLGIFGRAHTPKNGKWNSISDKGVMVTLLDEQRRYDMSQAMIMQHIGKQVQVIYDECDLSRVLVTDGKNLRFVAYEFGNVPSNFADYKDGDAQRIKALQEEGNSLIPMIEEWAGDATGRLLKDAKARVQAGVMKKAIAHEDAKVLAAHMHGSDGVMTIERGGNDVPSYAEATAGGAKSGELEGGVCAENGTNEAAIKEGVKVLKASKKHQNSIYDEW